MVHPWLSGRGAFAAELLLKPMDLGGITPHPRERLHSSGRVNGRSSDFNPKLPGSRPGRPTNESDEVFQSPISGAGSSMDRERSRAWRRIGRTALSFRVRFLPWSE